MREIAELVCTLPWEKLKSGPYWNLVLKPNSKMAKLFDIIYRQQAITDTEAAVLIYNTPDALSRVSSLKNKLKERLLDVLFLLDLNEPAYSDRQKAYFECTKRWATATTLLSKKIKTAGIEQLEQLLRHSQHFEFTDLSINALYHLRLHYGTLIGDAKKYELYRALYREYQAVWAMENEAEELYTQLMSRFVCSRAPQMDVAAQAENYFLQIEPYLKQSTSFRLHLSGRLLQLMVYSSRNDYRTVADLCEAAVDFFRQKPYTSDLPLQAFYYQLVVSCVQLRDFGRGQAIIRQNADIYEEGSFNWFKVQELYFLLALHTQHYDDAYDTCSQVIQQASMAQQPAQIQEMWKIYEAYMYLLIHIRRVDRVSPKTFRLARFLNEIPVFSKDKRGMNIPILILQTLYDILNKRFDEAIDRVEAISKYTSRYIKKDEHFRSNCFLKMLLQIPEAAFHRVATERKAERYRNQLKTMPLEIANQPHEIEIIPYEDLWDMVLELLPQQRMGRFA